MRIVFIGPPGAGKGTQCGRVSRQYNLPHISSGEMLRASKGDSAIGKLIASYIDGGNLAPDDLVMRFIIDRLQSPDCEHGCLFDGFPRTLNQAELIDAHLAKQEQKIDAVLNLEVQEDVLVERLLARAKVEHRADDTLETITARLRVFRERTAPVLGHYQAQGVVRSIDGMQSPDDVFQSICRALDA